MIPAELIKKKRSGHELSLQELEFMVLGFTKGEIPDYQMSALLMAIYFRGLSPRETLDLTDIMLNSGERVNFSPGRLFVDKHSTGGVGDKTSLILGPIAASCGVPVPMISGRGLGHTGGTLDKLESIPGFRTNLSLNEFKAQTELHNICFIGQTLQICPADRKLYALRDVTATVESLPLICASILSKKFAEGINALVLDVKFGTGAFMKTFGEARNLALALQELALGQNKKCTALLTNMNQPLGSYIGNSLEVYECLEILRGKSKMTSLGVDLYEDTRELSLQLAAHMIFLGGAARDLDAAYEKAKQSLDSGLALTTFEKLCRLQEGDLSRLPLPQVSKDLLAQEGGFVDTIDTEALGYASITLGAGRLKSTDKILPTAGLELLTKVGQFIRKGESWMRLWSDSPQLLGQAEARLASALKLSPVKTQPAPLIQEVLFGR